jgi:hypothetical protein
MSATPLAPPALPPFWQRSLVLVDGGLKGDVLLVFLLKGVAVGTGTELNRNNGQRDWRAKFAAAFPDGTVPPDRVLDVVKGVNHGYKGSPGAHDMVVQLMAALGADVTTMQQYYSHCRAVQRDLGQLVEEDLDYLDLFGDGRRDKIYVEEGGVGRTMACVADCLRLHPKLMEVTWNASQAARDSERLFVEAGEDIARFNHMLDADSRCLKEGIQSTTRVSLNEYVLRISCLLCMHDTFVPFITEAR